MRILHTSNICIGSLGSIQMLCSWRGDFFLYLSTKTIFFETLETFIFTAPILFNKRTSLLLVPLSRIASSIWVHLLPSGSLASRTSNITSAASTTWKVTCNTHLVSKSLQRKYIKLMFLIINLLISRALEELIFLNVKGHFL